MHLKQHVMHLKHFVSNVSNCGDVGTHNGILAGARSSLRWGEEGEEKGEEKKNVIPQSELPSYILFTVKLKSP